MNDMKLQLKTIYQRIVDTVRTPTSPTSQSSPQTPTTPQHQHHRRILSRELRVNPELFQRRQFYHCGGNFYSVDEIPKYVDEFQGVDTAITETPASIGDATEETATVAANKKQQQQPRFLPNQEINEKISIWRGDITLLEADAIVNAANESLLGGGGIDGAIHMAAGPELQQYNALLGGCPVGSARLSPGYRLPAKYVISTVGPQGEHPLALRSCYEACLEIAAQNREIESIAFCCVSVGNYGYELDKATNVALETVRRWLERSYNRIKINRIIFVVYNDREEQMYRELMPTYFPLVGEQEQKPNSALA